MTAGTSSARRGDILGAPSAESMKTSTLARYVAWLAAERGVEVSDYASLWRWSTSETGAFWASLWDYFDVGSTPPHEALANDVMPHADWFPGATLNYAAEVFKRLPRTSPALIVMAEDAEPREVWADEIERQVGALASALRAAGVGPGDRVAGYLSNTEHAVIGLLATASIGAIWTSSAPDFGEQSVVDRFTQVEPTALIATTGYRFNGRHHDRSHVVRTLIDSLPSLRTTIVVDGSSDTAMLSGARDWASVTQDAQPLDIVDVPFDHPLWILFSSGTTGTPKGIVHGHGGIVLEHLKTLHLGTGIDAAERVYVFTSTSWMMWNWLVGNLLVGATPVLFDGSPTHPGLAGSWSVAARSRAHVFGTGAAYLTASEKAGLRPSDELDLSALHTVLSTGSPLPTSTWSWVSEVLGPRVRLDSGSGGTDICGGIVSGSPWLPVYLGEISGPCLGVAAAAYDESANAVVGQVGELVITRPMPSMPVQFWADPDGSRYADAYFDMYDGVWRHGDWVEFTDRGTAILSGRSDATLNKAGVRMGTGEIYSVLDFVPGVEDSLVLGFDLPDGGYWMPLFITVPPDADVPAIKERVVAAIRAQLSPRHVPDEILVAPAVPRTLTGKRLEVPVKRVMLGAIDPSTAISRGTLVHAESLEWYADQGRRTVQPRVAPIDGPEAG